jgi:hypothetical protein
VKDELQQEVPPRVKLVAVQSWLCGGCGHAMAAHQWLHMEIMMKRGFQEIECLNSKCDQGRKVVRMPFAVHTFPQV